jgi:3-oxoacyl-[acyl-carrier-protein] synthase II
MLMERVVVTGMAGTSPIGNDWQQVSSPLKAQSTSIQYMQDWEKYKGLNTRLGAYCFSRITLSVISAA